MSSARRRHVSLLPAVVGVDPSSSRAQRWWAAVQPGAPLAEPSLQIAAHQVAYTVYHPGEEAVSWSYQQVSEPTAVQIGDDTVRAFGVTGDSAVAMRWNPRPTGIRRLFGSSRKGVEAGIRFPVASIQAVECGRIRTDTQVRIDFLVDVFRCVLFFETVDHDADTAAAIDRWATGLAGQPKSFAPDDHRWEMASAVAVELPDTAH